jgi:hypothetical protein
MSPELQQRIQNLMGDEPVPMPMEMAEGGEVSQEEMLMQAMEGEAEAQADPDEALRSSIEELMMQASQAEDPAERDKYLHLVEAAEVGSQAPMAEMAIQLAQAGRGEDTALAHVRPGEVIIPPEAFEDPEFESLIEKKFEELNIDPSRMVVGVGIASLNPITGLEEFGFFKKLAKSVKKVVKKVVKPLAKVAQFIPGPWQPIAALANKAFTVYDVAKGRANPLSLLAVAGPGAIGGSIGENIGAISKAGSGSFLKGLGSLGKASFSNIGSSVGNIGKGIGGLFRGGGKDGVGSFGRVGDFFGGAGNQGGLFTGGGADGVGNFGRVGDFFGSVGDSMGITNYAGQAGQIAERDEDYEVLDNLYQSFGDGSQGVHPMQQQILDLQEQGVHPSQILAMLQQSQQQSQGGFGGIFSGGGADGVGNYGVVGDLLGGFTDKLGLTNYGGGAGSGSGGGLNLGGIGGAGVAAVLAKLAYDEAKNRRGVQLTPAMTMNKYGGYQMAKRDAEAAGEAAPDPIDYGLLPSPMPMLSGGRQAPAQEEQPEGMRYGGAVMPQQMRYGGMVPMAYAEGGNVATEDFKRKNGGINGEGTETSDDIPAMLSDGEFVMTGQAVRGAGSFDLQSDGGIITLTPNGGENREKGTQLMYEMMELFAEFADKPKTKRAKAA